MKMNFDGFLNRDFLNVICSKIASNDTCERYIVYSDISKSKVCVSKIVKWKQRINNWIRYPNVLFT